jgi:hypothetical protein
MQSSHSLTIGLLCLLVIGPAACSRDDSGSTPAADGATRQQAPVARETASEDTAGDFFK